MNVVGWGAAALGVAIAVGLIVLCVALGPRGRPSGLAADPSPPTITLNVAGTDEATPCFAEVAAQARELSDRCADVDAGGRAIVPDPVFGWLYADDARAAWMRDQPERLLADDLEDLAI